MSNVVKMSDYTDKWKTVFSSEDETSSLYVYEHEDTGELEIVQMNDADETIRTCLDETCTRLFREVLNNR